MVYNSETVILQIPDYIIVNYSHNYSHNNSTNNHSCNIIRNSNGNPNIYYYVLLARAI